jgi:hypothetical protein
MLLPLTGFNCLPSFNEYLFSDVLCCILVLDLIKNISVNPFYENTV